MFSEYRQRGYFDEALGYDCVDQRRPYGTMGSDPEGYAFIRLRRPGLWPISRGREYTEVDVFDIIEFLHDEISKPTDRHFHDYSNCGYHSNTWDKTQGRQEFRQMVNPFLSDYGKGYELTEAGEVLEKGDVGLQPLFVLPLPTSVPGGIKERVAAAIHAFRRHDVSPEDKRNSVRTLAGILEHLRPLLKQVLKKKDESDLFELANGFGIRHLRADQRTDYDPEIWLPWMFYYYLAAIHASTRLIRKAGLAVPPLPSASSSPTSSENEAH